MLKKPIGFLLILLLGGFGLTDISDIKIDQKRLSHTAIDIGPIFDRLASTGSQNRVASRPQNGQNGIKKRGQKDDRNLKRKKGGKAQIRKSWDGIFGWQDGMHRAPGGTIGR